MTLTMYQVDAFTEKPFSGNPAAVCPLKDEWLNEVVMQNIAMENNLAETAFYIYKAGQHYIRWFTPEVEVALCGHATLASAYVLFNFENYSQNLIYFNSRSGILTARKDGDFITLNFPIDQYEAVNDNGLFNKCFDLTPNQLYKGKTDYMLIFDNESQINNIKCDFLELNKIDARGIIITAKGSKSNFVSRFFAPKCGIPEDPVTGSAHTTLTPYWSKVFNKSELTAMQLSKRQGFLRCKLINDRVEISGKAVPFFKGEINI